MKLADWLHSVGLTPADLRRMLGIKSRSTVPRWCTGERIPQPHDIVRIKRLSGGKVDVDDFIAPGDAECATVITRPDGLKKLLFPWSNQASEREVSVPTRQDLFEEENQPPVAVQKATAILGPRIGPVPKDGLYLLDGRPADYRTVIAAANRVLRQRRAAPIVYLDQTPGFDQ